MRIVALVVGTLLGGCAGGEEVGACTLLPDEDGGECPPCDDGPYECTFGSTVVEVPSSCGDCGARQALYAELCDAEDPATAEEIEEGTVCSAIPAQ